MDKNKQRVQKSFIYLLLIGFSVLFIFPFIWMVGTSLTSSGMVLDRARPIIPLHPVWHNYIEALTVLPFGIFLKNTLTISILSVIGQTLSASLVAFAFARLKFPGRDALFILVLSTMMLPPQVTMIPTFIMFTIPGWIDSLKPLIIPSFFGGGAFFIFLLRQFFLTIPAELEDAARIDGCSSFGIYRHVIMPLSKPALTAVALFSFIGHWNDFLGPLIYTQSMDKKTLALGLNAFKGLHGTEYNLMMAASVAVLVPIIVIFFFSQKYFVEGVVTSGVKG
jgi:ABC-type glycerol-3-phosphate transport system permease component